MWLSMNYLLGNFKSPNTGTIVDIGGASAQIAFQPESSEWKFGTGQTNRVDLTLPDVGNYSIYDVSFLNYGNDQARRAVVRLSLVDGADIITSPCYHSWYSGTWEEDATK
jgi:Golgi nucleoside diphosphatase